MRGLFRTCREIRTLSGLLLLPFVMCAPVAAAGQDARLTAPAVVRAEAEAVFSSSLSGTIEALPFKEGMMFDKGDVLVRLDCDLQRAEAEATAADHRAALAEFESQKALLSRGGVGSVAVAVAEAKAAAALAREKLAMAVVSGCEIMAPFDGYVVETTVNQFEYVNPSQPLLSVVSAEPPDLEINAPAVWLRWIGVGSEGQVALEATGDIAAIRISGIGAAIDPVSATIRLTAEFLGDIPDILPGMSGLARFE